MSKRKGICVLVVILTASIFFMVLYSMLVKEETIYYQPDGEKNPMNPARGFYVQMDSADRERLEKYSGTVRLCLLAYDLYEYRDREIPEEKLEELSLFLQEAKKNNMKCIFRAAYGFDREEVNDAESLQLVEKHIRQIVPVLNEYKEQIYCVQAGFFGPWGEWHSSIYLENEEQAKENRNWLLTKLTESLNEEIVINVRRPRFVRDAWEAGLAVERFGIHNDGLLGSDTDLGTYDGEYSRKEELVWMKEELKTGINGGEMPIVNEFARSSNAVSEFENMKISYLNLKYNEEIYEQWKQEHIDGENSFDYISKRIGYRYYISEILYPVNLKEGLLWIGQKVEVTIRNEGFAPIGDGYVMEWVIMNEAGEIIIIDGNSALSDTGAGESMLCTVSARELKKLGAVKLGIRISEKNDKEKNPVNCVELINTEVDYVDGVNYFIGVDTEGNVAPVFGA